MDQFELIAYALIFILILLLLHILGGFVIKRMARYTKDFWFIYHFIPRHIKRPDCTMSKYYDRFPMKTGAYWHYAPQIDDPFMKELANNILAKVGKKSNRYIAGYILQLVQYGYTYRSDKDTYGVAEKWAFPVCTSLLHIGDCEDGSLLGAGLSKLCGSDTVTVSLEGHAMYAVRVNGFGMKVEHNGKKYLLCETTSVLPLGLNVSSAKIYGQFDVSTPTQEYLIDYTVYDSFDKYPLK